MNRNENWYELIVGNGNVNQGLARVMGFILAFVVVVGAIFWMIYPV
ncbi:hypothetical protein HGP17_17385 [Rhizobium sp. P38BS-XIX]|nr:hypothetical protein [Rhizobium sp. P38BS-XIX]NLR98594.1 hypothetical protein [Rhizobium sp. P38BS-XIX]